MLLFVGSLVALSRSVERMAAYQLLLLTIVIAEGIGHSNWAYIFFGWLLATIVVLIKEWQEERKLRQLFMSN